MQHQPVAQTPPPQPPNSLLLAGYALMIAAAVGLFFLIRGYGETLHAPPPHAAGIPPDTAAPKPDVLLHVLLALAAVIILGRTLGVLLAYVHQPPVIGEVLAGILLGPSLLGRVAPHVADYVFPAAAAPFLSVVAQLGVILYMFLIGLELNPALVRRRAQATVAISHASIVVPFLLGACLAIALYPRLSTSNVPFTSFALFIGVAMSITAFPVLARILTDQGISKTELGVVALTCAATDDVTAWCLLALVVGVAQAKLGSALWVVALTLAYIAFMFLCLGPLVTRWVRKHDGDPASEAATVIVLVALLLSAFLTELIGVHAIFGAFLLGAVIPHDSALARTFTRNLEGLVTILLLPAFFAVTGMRTEVGLLTTLDQWLLCGLIVVVATAGKFGGTLAAARLTGFDWTTSAALGLLMNTRGLMQLIVLNIGLDLGVISPTLFAMLVLMALATTIATTPLLRLLTPSPHPSSAS